MTNALFYKKNAITAATIAKPVAPVLTALPSKGGKALVGEGPWPFPPWPFPPWPLPPLLPLPPLPLPPLPLPPFPPAEPVPEGYGTMVKEPVPMG